MRDTIRQEKQQTNQRLDGSRDILRIGGMNQAGVRGGTGLVVCYLRRLFLFLENSSTLYVLL